MKSQLESQLEKNGIHATYVTKDFNLWRGLILSEVSVFETARKENPVLSVSGIGVAYNLLDIIFSGGTSAVRISMSDSNVSVWDREAKYTISGINTQMSVGRKRVDVEQFSAAYGDLALSLRAKMDFEKVDESKDRKPNGDALKNGPRNKNRKKKKGIDVSQAIEILKQIPDTPDGELDVAVAYDFSGRAKTPTIRGFISGKNVRWQDIVLDSLQVSLDSRDLGKNETAIQIPQAVFRIGDRDFSLTGEYNPVRKTVRLDSLNSSIYLKPIIETVISKLGENTGQEFLDFPDHAVSATGVLDLENPINSQLQGNFKLLVPYTLDFEGKKTVVFESANLAFQVAERGLKISEIDSTIATRGELLQVTGAASAAFEESNDNVKTIGLDGLMISRGAGSLALVGEYSVNDGVVELKQTSSDLDFVAVIEDLGLENPLGPVKYSAPPKIDLSGKLALKKPLENELHGSISVPGEIEIELPNGEAPLVIKNLNAAGFGFSGEELSLQDTSFEIGDNTITQFETSLNILFGQIVEDKKSTLQLKQLAFESLKARRDGGEMYAEGAFDPIEKKLNIERLESTLDLMAVLGEFRVPDVISGRVTFPSPPTIAVMGEIPFDNPEETALKGSISSDSGLSVGIGADRFLTVHRFEILEFIFRDSKISIPKILGQTGPSGSELMVDAAVDVVLGEESRLSIGNAEITRNGRALILEASMPLPINEINLTKLDSNLDILAAMADFGIGDPTGGKVKFNEPPVISARASINFKDPEQTSGIGTIEMPAGFSVILNENESIGVRNFKAGECRIVGRGGTMEGLSAVVDAGESPILVNADLGFQTYAGKNPVLGIKKLEMIRGERAIDLVGALPLGEGKLVITEFKSSIDPIGLLKDLGMGDPTQGKVVFNSPPAISGNGEIAFADTLQNSAFQGEIKSSEGLKINIDGNKSLDVASFETTFGIGNGGVATPRLVAQTMGGTVQANTVLRPLANPIQFEAAIRLTDVKLEELTGYFDAGSERTGLVSGEFRGGGQATLEGVQGVGSVHVEEARLTQLTLFKGLRPLLMAINLGEWKSEDLGAEITANFALNRGILGSEDIELVGDFYRIKSKMNLDFPQKNMNAQGAVSTTGATRVITEIVGKILEVEAEGPFDNINWKLKNAPGVGSLKDLTSLSGDILKNTLTGAAQPGKLIQNAGNVAKDTLGNAGKLTTDLGKKLLGLGRQKEEEPKNESDATSSPPTTPESGSAE